MGINNELRGLVYSKYKNKAELAKTIGWSRQRLDKALSNPKAQSLENYQRLCEALGLQDDSHAYRFFMPIDAI